MNEGGELGDIARERWEGCDLMLDQFWTLVVFSGTEGEKGTGKLELVLTSRGGGRLKETAGGEKGTVLGSFRCE